MNRADFMNTKNLKESWAVLRHDEFVMNVTNIKKVFEESGKLFVELNTDLLNSSFDKTKKIFCINEIQFFFKEKIVSYQELIKL